MFMDYLWNEWKLIKYLKHKSYFDFNLLFDDSEDILSEWPQVAVLNISYYVKLHDNAGLKCLLTKFAI